MINTNNRIEFDEFKKHQYMMATLANHRYGILSSKEPSLCYIYGETEDSFVGCWVFLHTDWYDILFPKKSTRDLTKAEEILNQNISNGEIGLKLKDRHSKLTLVK